MQVAHYFQDAATLSAATSAFTRQLHPPGHPAARDATAELQNLPDAFILHVLCSFAAEATLGHILEAIPDRLHAHAILANTERRRFVEGVSLQRGGSAFAPLFAATAPLLNGADWLDLSCNGTGLPDAAAARPQVQESTEVAAVHSDCSDASFSRPAAKSAHAAGESHQAERGAAQIVSPRSPHSDPMCAGSNSDSAFAAVCPFNSEFTSACTAADSTAAPLSDGALPRAAAQATHCTRPSLQSRRPQVVPKVPQMAAMAPHLASLTALQSLDLTDNALGTHGASGAAALATALPQLCLLQDLFLGSNNLGAAGAAALAPALPPLRALQLLDLSDNGLDAAAAAALAPPLAALPCLRALDLCINALNSAAAAAIVAAATSECSAPAPPCTCLLQPQQTRSASNSSPQRWPQPCVQPRTLAALFLGLNKVGGMAALGRRLAAASALRDLDLSCASLGASGAAALAAALPNVPRLVRLDLERNLLTARAIDVLAPALASLTELEHLTLSANAFADEGAVALAAAVCTSYLSAVRICANDVQEDTAMSICDAKHFLHSRHAAHLMKRALRC